jgi:cytochrome c oxidase subunit 1
MPGAYQVSQEFYLEPLSRRKSCGPQPLARTALEWRVLSPPPVDDFGANDPVVYRGAYEFSMPGVGEDFVPQHVAPACPKQSERASPELRGEIRKDPVSEGSRLRLGILMSGK